MKQKSDTIAGINNASLGWRGRALIFLSVLGGLGVTIYGEPLYALFAAVFQRQGSSHGLFVPFISGYLIWLKLDKIKGLTPQVALPACPGFSTGTYGASTDTRGPFPPWTPHGKICHRFARK